MTSSRRKRQTQTPLEVVQTTTLASRLYKASSAARTVNPVAWWMFSIAAATVVMFSVSAGNTPESFAQTESAGTDPVDMPSMDDWDKLAKCESGGDWSIDTGNGYSGGIQFDKQTWKANGGKTDTAAEASKEEQIAVAEKVWTERGWSPWPDCSSKTDFSIDKPTDKSAGSIIGASSTGGGSSGGDSDDGDISARDRGDGSAEEDSLDDIVGEAAGSIGGSTDVQGVVGDGSVISEDMLRSDFGSPVQYAMSVVGPKYNEASAACEFLTVCRYRNVDLLQSAPVLGGGDYANAGSNAVTSIARVLTDVAQTAFYFLEQMLIYGLSIDIFSKGAYLANAAFFKSGEWLFVIQDDGDGSYSFSTPMIIVLWIGLMLIVGLVSFLFRANGRGREPIKFAIYGVVLSSLAILLVIRAGANVSQQEGGFGTSVVSESLKDENLIQSASSDEVVKMAEEPSNWAAFSPGWIMMTFSSWSSQISAFVAQIVNVALNAVSNTSMSAPSQCDIYTNALYASFASTKAAENMGPGRVMTIISYDRMVNSLFNKNYAAGALGDSDGAQNAWCRLAEADTNRPAGQQAMLSRVAGLNREVVGTGGFGLVADNNNQRHAGRVANLNSVKMPNQNGAIVQVSGGTMVDSDGNWNMPDDMTREVPVSGSTDKTVTVNVSPVEVASRYFGPTYSKDYPEAARAQATYYWAACEWGRSADDGATRDLTGTFHPGGLATINPEWDNVMWARGSNEQSLGREDCAATGNSIISNQVDKQFGEEFTSATVDNVHSSHFEFSVQHTAWIEDPNLSDNGGDDEGCMDSLSNAWGCGVDYVKGKAVDAADWATGGAVSGVSSGLDTLKAGLEWFSSSTPAPQDKFADKFASAEASTGGNNAREYLARSSGYNPSPAIVTAIVSLIIAYMMIRMVGGLLVGGILVQVLALLAVLFGLLLLLATALWPSMRMRRGLATTGKTIVSSIVVDGFIVFVFASLFAINELLRSMILPVTQEMAASAMIGGIIAYISFKAFLMLAKQFTNMDIGTFDAAMQVAPVAAAPALKNFGFFARGPMDILKENLDKARRRRANRGAGGPRPGMSDAALLRKENKRKNIQRRFQNDQAAKQRRIAEKDDKIAQKREAARAKRRRERLMKDSGDAALAATGAGVPAAAARVAGRHTLGAIREGVRKAGHLTADTSRKTARALRDGASYASKEAKLALVDRMYGGEDLTPEQIAALERRERFVDNVSPGEATTTTQQQTETGTIYPNRDNVEAFDDKVPGTLDRSAQESANSVSTAADLHSDVDTSRNQWGKPVSVKPGEFDSETAYNVADRSAAVMSNPDSGNVMPVPKKSLSGNNDVQRAAWNAKQQAMEEDRQKSKIVNESNRKNHAANIAKFANSPDTRDIIRETARGVRSAMNSGSENRVAGASTDARGVFGMIAREGGKAVARKFKN